MAFIETDFPGLFVYEPRVFDDDRGYFFESYNESFFQQHKIGSRFIQDNQSHSKKNVIRGLHFQAPPYAQAKLIRVLVGAIQDVVVDIRKGSPAYGRSFSVILSAENRKQLFIPRGFAHGFAVISDTADVMYKCDNYYHKESEGGIIYNDPSLQIQWQVPGDKAIISSKDLELPLFAGSKHEFSFSNGS